MINEEFNAVKGQMSSQIQDMSDIETIIENQLVMVSAIPLDDDQPSSGG